MYDGKPPPGNVFQTVPGSMFSLFKLMNGDDDVVEFMEDSEGFQKFFSQILFAVFLIMTNWAILAILTSVVSDNMILSSRKEEAIEEEENNVLEKERQVR